MAHLILLLKQSSIQTLEKNDRRREKKARSMSGSREGRTDPYTLFFQPETLFLVVGATNKREKYGSKVFLELKSKGYNVIAINRNVSMGGEVHGTPAYPSVTAFLDRIERLFNKERRAATIKKIVLVLVVPPAAALAVVQEGVAHGIKKVWFQPGAESDAALTFCKEHDIVEVHGQCVMIAAANQGPS